MADNVSNIWDKDQVTPDYEGNELHIALQTNRLASTEDETVYYGRIIKMGSIGKDTIIQDLVTLEQDEGLGSDGLLRVWNLLDAAVIDRVKRGYFVKTGICSIRLKVKGTFNTRTEAYSAEKHAVLPVLIASDELKDSLADVKVEVVQGNTTAPEITSIYDYGTDKTTTATQNALLELNGSNIKVAGEDEAVGVWFTNEEAADDIRVDPPMIAVNTRNRVTVVVPLLTAGTYRVRITTQYAGSGSTLRREPVSAEWKDALTVISAE